MLVNLTRHSPSGEGLTGNFGGMNVLQSHSLTLVYASGSVSVPLAYSFRQLHPYVLPIMQGYCQISSFVVESETVDYIVISRRSRDRAGLRYQRRGVDDDAHVANFVETETIVRVKVRLPSLLLPPVLTSRSEKAR